MPRRWRLGRFVQRAGVGRSAAPTSFFELSCRIDSQSQFTTQLASGLAAFGAAGVVAGGPEPVVDRPLVFLRQQDLLRAALGGAEPDRRPALGRVVAGRAARSTCSSSSCRRTPAWSGLMRSPVRSDGHRRMSRKPSPFALRNGAMAELSTPWLLMPLRQWIQSDPQVDACRGCPAGRRRGTCPCSRWRT